MSQRMCFDGNNQKQKKQQLNGGTPEDNDVDRASLIGQKPNPKGPMEDDNRNKNFCFVWVCSFLGHGRRGKQNRQSLYIQKPGCFLFSCAFRYDNKTASNQGHLMKQRDGQRHNIYCIAEKGIDRRQILNYGTKSSRKLWPGVSLVKFNSQMDR